MLSAAHRLPIVGVMGSGSEEHAELAEPLGAWLAGLNVHLLTGGGGGVMAVVSRAFCQVRPRKGLVLGIIPGEFRDDQYQTKAGYPNPWVEIPIYTHLPLSGRKGQDALSRNHINILSARVIVALPGGSGTASEVTLASRYGRPLIAFLKKKSDIPDLIPSIPVATDLAMIQEFIRLRLP